VDSDGLPVANIWFTWRVLLEWAIASMASPFPGADHVSNNDQDDMSQGEHQQTHTHTHLYA